MLITNGTVQDRTGCRSQLSYLWLVRDKTIPVGCMVEKHVDVWMLLYGNLILLSVAQTIYRNAEEDRKMSGIKWVGS